MVETSLKVLAWDVPLSKTQPALELLKPFLLSQQDMPALLSRDDQQNRLLVHPRIQAENGLPANIVTGCYDLGANCDFHIIKGLTLSQVERLWTVQFFSGSKPSTPLSPGLSDTWQRVLSNFYPTSLVIEGKSYLSVEHFFQAQKAHSSSKPEMANWFTSDYQGAEAVASEASAAKKAGSRKSYRQHNATLDMSHWEKHRVAHMRLAVHQRYEQDILFQRVLDSTKKMKLLHFERAGSRSFWGGNFSRENGNQVGQNQLGLLLMALRDNGSGS